MKEYIINIPNEKATSYKLVTFIIAMINLAAFVYLLLQGGKQLLATGGIVISVLCLAMCFKKNKTIVPPLMTAEAAFGALSMFWIASGNVLPGLLMLIVAVLGFYTNRRAAIKFNQEGIWYPSVPAKLFPWNLVDFVMLRDGILTIELKDNRVFQFTLPVQEAAAHDEQQFNGFCRQLAAAASTPQ